MELKDLSNDKLFPRYETKLVLRIRNPKNLKNIVNLLLRFRKYLGDFPPSPDLAKGFLAQYKGLKPHSWYNYVGEMRRIMAWYGEKLDVKAKLPKTLPAYHEDKGIDVSAWIDAKTWLLGCPIRLVQIANKKLAGKPLKNQEHQYLWYYRQKKNTLFAS